MKKTHVELGPKDVMAHINQGATLEELLTALDLPLDSRASLNKISRATRLRISITLAAVARVMRGHIDTESKEQEKTCVAIRNMLEKKELTPETRITFEELLVRMNRDRSGEDALEADEAWRPAKEGSLWDHLAQAVVERALIYKTQNPSWNSRVLVIPLSDLIFRCNTLGDTTVLHAIPALVTDAQHWMNNSGRMEFVISKIEETRIGNKKLSAYYDRGNITLRLNLLTA